MSWIAASNCVLFSVSKSSIYLIVLLNFLADIMLFLIRFMYRSCIGLYMYMYRSCMISQGVEDLKYYPMQVIHRMMS